MHTDFKYFHWAMPEQGCGLYGLYDVFDNQLLLLTYDFDIAWQLKNIIKSKIILEIVDFSNQINAISEKIDNSIVETWGLSRTPTHLFQDIRSLSNSYRDKTKYRQDILIKDFEIAKNNVEFDTFKQDLQQQLFFFHYCLSQAKNFCDSDTNIVVQKQILISAELCESCMDAIDRFLNLSFVADKNDIVPMLYFLTREKILYE
jgi:hypothetical protein